MPVIPLKTPPDSTGVFRLSEDDFQHLSRSLRLKPGDSFQVFLPDGHRAQATLLPEPEGRSGKIEKVLTEIAPKNLPLWLGVGMVRWSFLEWLVEKATELGVERISPLYLEFGKFAPEQGVSQQKMARLNKIAEETLKQCERILGPRIDSPQSLGSWLRETEKIKKNKFLFDETVVQPRMDVGLFHKTPPYVFLIGPEGGFAPKERELALAQGYQSVSLGAKKLRTETAALYATSLLDSYLKF